MLLSLEIRLRKQKQQTAPTVMDTPIPTEYADNCLMYDYVAYQADLFF